MPEVLRPSAADDPPTDEDFERAHGHVPGPRDELPLRSRAFLGLCLAATGAVFGNIGTSPLYTWNEIRLHGALETHADVLGAASLIVWTLTLLASGKYVGLVLAADNDGEGGTFALLSLVRRTTRSGAPIFAGLLVLATALLYGEGIVTPAISVLSAVDGIRVVDPHLGPFVMPATLVLLTGLFAVQYLGTDRAGRAFGPVLVAWFVVIGLLGLVEIVRHPGVLVALSPHWAIGFLFRHGASQTLAVLGSVMLCIAGAEALYAELGRFGRHAIRAGWAALAFPALVLQYLGQGAKLLSGDEIVADNVFFSLVPQSLTVPLIVLAVAATLVASQSVLSLAFGLTRAAINLGLLPRVAVVHTRNEVEGRIYMPIVTFWLWLGTCWLVAVFQTTSALAAAYGLAVMGTMAITSVALSVVAQERWGWSPRLTWGVLGPILALEGLYLVANVVKIPHGAWVTVVVAAVIYSTMRLWESGRQAIAEAGARVERATVRQLVDLKQRMPELPRAMVFLTGERVLSFDDRVPLVLLKFLDRYGALPRHLTMFSVVLEPNVPHWRARRFDVRQFGENVTSVRMHVGYMEAPNARAALVHLKKQRQIKIHATRWTIVMGREEIFVKGGGPWRIPYLLFGLLSSVAGQAHLWFGIGTDTGISKEVIPLVVGKEGQMNVVVRKPELEMPRPPSTEAVRVPTEEIPRVVTEDTTSPPVRRPS